MRAARSRRRTARRVGSLALNVLLWCFAMVLFAMVATVAFARSSWGGRYLLREQVLPRVNALIAGRLSATDLAWKGGTLGLRGLALYDPEGQPVAAAQSIEVRVDLRRLLARRVVVESLLVERAWLGLRTRAKGGNNLARAVASKTSETRTQPAPDHSRDGKPWSFVLGQLRVVAGSLSVKEEAEGTSGPARLDVAEIFLTAAASWNATRPGQVAVSVETHARVQKPFAATVQAHARGAGSIGRGEAQVTGAAGITSGRSALELAWEVRAPAGAPPGSRLPADLEVAVTRLDLDPSLAQALLPAWRLPRPLSGTGSARWAGKGQTGQARLALASGATRIAATASVVGAAPSRARVTVRGSSIDLAALDARLPSSRLAIALAAEAERSGSGKSHGRWWGSLKADVGPGLLQGRPLGPSRVRLMARDGNYRLDELRASLPGTTLTVRGSLTGGRLGVRATLDVSDLGLTVASLLPEQTSEHGRASGRGRADIRLGGSLAAPALALAGDFAGLRWGTAEIPRAQLALSIPDMRRPLASRLDLRVPSALLGTRRVSGVSCRLRGDGARFETALEVAAPGPLRLAAGGTWRRRGRILVLDRATLGLGGQTFRLAERARLDVEPGLFRLAGAELLGDAGQSLRVAGTRRGERWNAEVGATAIDLGRLPDFLLPESARVEGRLTADVRARGGATGGTIDGQLEVVSAVAAVRGRFALPLAWPPPPGAQLDAELSLSGVELARVAALARPLLAGKEIALAGTAAARVRLSGTGREPRFVLDADLRGLRIRDQAIGDVRVAARAEDRKTLHATLDWAAGREGGAGLGHGSVALAAGIGLGAVLDGRPEPPLSAVPLELRAEIEEVSLSGLAAVAGARRKLGGTASLSAALTGTAAAPRGEVKLRLAGVTAPGVPATDGDLRIRLEPQEATAMASVMRRGATLLSGTARLGGSPAVWRSPMRLGQQAIAVHATLGPIDLQHDGTGAGGGQAPRRTLRGKARAEVELTGTPRNPRLQVDAAVADLRLDGKAMGDGEVKLGYENRELRVLARLASASGGELRAQARLAADLGYPDRLAFTAWRRSPLAAHVEATGLDLAVLAGATPGLRSVSGRLFANLDIDGSLADPRPSGRLEWKDGGLTVTGMGEYKNVKLRVRGDRERLVLEELSGESGAGRARLTAEAVHRAEGGYQIETRIGTERLPVYVEGQALASVSVDASAKATVVGGHVRARTAMTSARFELQDVKRKHLQKLDLPGDVVLVDDGRPLDETEARKLAGVEAKLRALRGDEHPPTAGTPTTAPAVPDPKLVMLIDATNNLWVRGKDANVELGLEPGFRIEVGRPTRIYGRILLKRGRVDIVGRRFDLEEGSSLRFSGPLDQPELDVRARYHNESENITVLATVKGSPGSLQTSLTVPGRPDLTESQIYTLVVTGRLRFGGGSASSSTPSEQAQSILGGLLAGQLQKLVAKKLPFDVLSIEGGSTAGSARLEAGRYVAPDLYIGYVGRLGADPLLLQNRNAVHLEYDLGARWSFQGEYGDAKTGSADVVWTKRY